MRHGSAGRAPREALRVVRLARVDDVRVRADARCLVVALHEQPLGLLALHARAYQVPFAAELLAVQQELEMAFCESLAGLDQRFPGPVVPDVDVPAAILALGNIALELRIGDGVVLDFDGESLVGRVERRPLGHCPAAQGALPLEAEVPVQPPCGVFLHYKDE